MINKVEVLPTVLCPKCGSLFLLEPGKSVTKLNRKNLHNRDIDGYHVDIKRYMVSCGNRHCPDYYKVKLVKAVYAEVECIELDDR